MAQIKLLKGTGVTLTSPAIKDGQLLFDTAAKSLWLDINATTRIKLYDSLDTAITDITNLKNKLAGIDTTVVAAIEKAIEDLKKETIVEVENSNTVTLSSADNADAGGKKIKAEVKLSPKADNALKNGTGTDGEEGLYVAPAVAPEYTIEKAEAAETGFASTYKLMKDGTQVGDSINIAKDKFLKSVEIVDSKPGAAEDDDPVAGKFIKMVFEDDTNSEIYLDINELVDVYTSGSAAGDMIVVAVDSTTNKITATITDGTVTKAKLDTGVQTSLGLADSAVQPEDLDLTAADGKYVAGIKVDASTKEITLIEKDLPSLDGLEWGSWA